MKNEPTALKSDYYFENFSLVSAVTQARYRDFFTEEEHAVLDGFGQMSRAAQMLYVRFLNRKGRLFDRDRLQYPEIGPVEKPLRVLADQGLVSGNLEGVPLEECLAALTLEKLDPLCQAFGLPAKGGRILVVQRLLALGEELRGSLQVVLHWVVVQKLELFERLLVLFFCNRHKNLSDFVKVDLGHIRYETYEVDEKRRFFFSRRHLEAYLQWGQYKDRVYEEYHRRSWEKLAQDFAPVVAQWEADQPWSRSILRILELCAAGFERLGRWKEAVAAYETIVERGRSDHALRRLVHCLEKSGEEKRVLQLCTTLLDEDELLPPSQVLFLRFHYNKCAKRLQQAALPSLPLHKPGIIKLTCLKEEGGRTAVKARYRWGGGEWVSVEEVVLLHYREAGWDGIHVENAFVLTLGAILCWQQLYAPLPGVFQHPFQMGPLDLHHPDFYRGRQTLFQARFEALSRLDNEQLWLLFQRVYEEKKEVACAMSAAAYLEPSVFRALLLATPPARLVALIRSMFEAWPHSRRGFPDLVLWRNDAEILFVEVKGCGDRLSEAQKIWHDTLLRLGFHVVLAAVISEEPAA